MTLNPHHAEEAFTTFEQNRPISTNNVVQFPRSPLQDEVSANKTGYEGEQLKGVALNTDPVRDYLRQISKVDLLTADEEVELSKQIEIGVLARERLENEGYSSESERRELEFLVHEGERSNARMVNANLRLVVSIAKRYYGRGMSAMDLIQEGNDGLIHAVKKFDYTQGNKFSTYATWWIRQAIQRSFADKGREIRLPVHLHEELSKVVRTRQSLRDLLGREPNHQEIADQVGEKNSERITYLLEINAQTSPVSMNVLIGDEEGAEFGDLIPDSAPGVYEQVQETVIHEEGNAFINRMLSSLPEKEALVIKLRYGLGVHATAMTLDEIGREMGVTRERIRQIETTAMRKIKREVQKDGLQDQSSAYLVE